MLEKFLQNKFSQNKFYKKISQKIFIIFLIFILSHTCDIYSMCASCGPSSRCGSCGESQPICSNTLCTGYPFLLPRDQGRNSAREIVCTQEAQNKYDINIFNGFLSIAAEYQRSFDNQQIPRYFFGQDYVSCKNLYIQGSQVENRNQNAWLADYFGLPSDFSSTVSFCPKIQNVILDLNFYFGLDNVTEGLYAKLDLPIAWTKTELNPCENICNPGINPAIAGYLSTETILRENLTENFLQFMSGNSTFGDMQEPLKYGLITDKKLTKAGLAELRASFGYNFVLNQDYHFGFAFLLSAPTGNQPCAKYLFEPIVGNGKHWEMGCELTGKWIFHRCAQDPDKYLGFWIDATLTHLANNCQCRSLDISCKPSSRYMLLEKMGLNLDHLKIENPDDLDSTVSTYQYQKSLVPAINWSTFKMNVEMDLQADIAIKLGIVRNNFSLDLGYNFWARTGERFAVKPCCACPPKFDMAIKGDAFIYGYYTDNQLESAIALGATQSEANIHTGKNYPAVPFGYNPLINPKIDNPNPTNYLTYSTDNITTLTHELKSINNLAINTSTQSILLINGDLNMDDSPSGMTHKLFANFNYYHKNDHKWQPFIGVGGEVEISTHRCKIPECNFSKNSCCNSCDNNCSNSETTSSNNNCCENNCCDTNSCNNSCLCDFCCDTSCNKRMGICQWGLWLKGGVSFN